MQKPIQLPEKLHEELFKEAGMLQQKEGKYISVVKLIELMLVKWRKSK